MSQWFNGQNPDQKNLLSTAEFRGTLPWNSWNNLDSPERRALQKHLEGELALVILFGMVTSFCDSEGEDEMSREKV